MWKTSEKTKVLKGIRLSKKILCRIIVLALIPVLYLSNTPVFSFNTESPSSAQEAMELRVGKDEVVAPIIRQPQMIDANFNGIQDSLESMISRMTPDRSTVLPVVVTLNRPVTIKDLNLFRMLRGQVTHIYRYVTYGFAGVIPATNILNLAQLEGDNLSVIEYDAPVQYHLDVSTPNIRARPIVWNTHGYTGSPNHSIAIIDTGIDDSHPDVGPYGDINFSRKIVGWYDATPDMVTTPEDYGEHGTHVAGIAAGTGAANSLQTSGFVTNTWSDNLNGVPWGYGYLHATGFEVMNPGLITLTCMWTSSNTIVLQLRDETGETVLAEKSGKQKPLVLTFNALTFGRYRPFVGIAGFPPKTGSGYFSLNQTFPYEGRNDGFNLFTGVAPTSKLVGVKVFDNSGSGTTSTVYEGMDWVIANKDTYNITVASMSLSLMYGAVNTTIDQKADTMVENGIVTVVSAGNDYPTYTIGSPGTAAYVITVAATNDQNGITSYSSNGDSNKNEYGLVKPDVAAPGGSTGVGNLIISADSNDVDYEYSGQNDYTSDDYQAMSGTSMSTPHVSGLASLIVDALSSWSWTKEEALKVKMIISMTAFEVQSGEETNLPSLDRGDKDNVEGYGRICADAAIEAATMSYTVGELANDIFGSAASDKKVWARQVQLSAGTEYEFRLSVPSDADYDLYLYDDIPDSYGQPVILGKSINSTSGVEESICYTPTDTSNYYIVAKWVEGNGKFNMTSVVVEHDVAVVDVTPIPTVAHIGQTVFVFVEVRNDGTVNETFDVTVFYDDTAIDTQIVSDLVPDTSLILTFFWSTADVSAGNYMMSATAESLPDETELLDNTFTDGFVQVKEALPPQFVALGGGGSSFLYDRV